MRRERRKKLTPAKLKAAGASRELVVRRIPPPAGKERGVKPRGARKEDGRGRNRGREGES